MPFVPSHPASPFKIVVTSKYMDTMLGFKTLSAAKQVYTALSLALSNEEGKFGLSLFKNVHGRSEFSSFEPLIMEGRE